MFTVTVLVAAATHGPRAPGLLSPSRNNKKENTKPTIYPYLGVVVNSAGRGRSPATASALRDGVKTRRAAVSQE
ncbi:unnamed protein product [Arctia plantaginis]|uniref:Uncharacterized protein n=1 Tax=Arctia plantaginis TaxID=874455 RepID=A0A8S1A408_ARCPL|nr:unnamed protein product [Arctia plantaginis]